MMKKIYQILFSMETMSFLILIFAASIGTATFIENDFGVPASQAVVFKTWWFELLLGWLAANLIANIFRYKLYRKGKLAMFLFHFSFLIILLGAAITRFVSYEGMMHIRQGDTSSSITSSDTYVRMWLDDGMNNSYEEEVVLFSVLTPKAFSGEAEVGGNEFRFETVNYIPNAREKVIDLPTGGAPYMGLVASFGMGRQNFFVKNGTTQQLGKYLVNFGNDYNENAVNFKVEDGGLLFNSFETVTTVSMMGGPGDTLLPGIWHPFQLRNLYQFKDLSLVLTNFYEHGAVQYATYDGKDMSFMDALIINVTSGNETKEVTLNGGKGYEGQISKFTLNGTEITMRFGAKRIDLPFSLELVKFDLERYPGSMSPSSYASDVILIDERNNLKEPRRIFMNNVLNYGGYRFFQSSYDKDELGTILSVNHDWWGTFFTYLGYLLMAIGMFLTPFSKNSRFAMLGKMLRKNADKAKGIAGALIIGITLIASPVLAQHTHNHALTEDQIPTVNKKQAEMFSELMVQSHDGRLEPINTLSSEVLRKISRKQQLVGMNADQVLLGMLSNPGVWQNVPMIKISKELYPILGVESKLASYMQFIDETRGAYKLQDYVNAAYAKKPAQRDMFDKEILKVDERLNICYMVFTGEILKILPDPNDPYKSWYSPVSNLSGVSGEDSIFLVTAVPTYFRAVGSNDIGLANELIKGIKVFQNRFGAEIMPSKRKVNMEITYNKMLIFDNLSKLYGLIGFIMLIFVFVEVFKRSKAVSYIIKGLTVLIVIGLLLQTIGLAMRWYISGHAPWSNGYESLIYIGWVTMLAGIVFSRRSKMTLAATTVLTSIILMVAHLSWMDPEITNLVPVLKSYWLTIHVSVITASYGFLALGMLLGFMNLVLMIFKNKKNFESLELKIKDLTAINERTLMVGLYMLTIGTFLGGVWANESWGRYWGWDPKETWALVSVLVYSFILHMHYVPGLKNYFSFNFASLIGYFSILMTYFGVNYYLSGLHSYAAGDPVPVPTFVYYTVAIIALVSLWAYINNRRFVKKEK